LLAGKSGCSLEMRFERRQRRDVLRSTGGALGLDDIFERRHRDVDAR